LWDRVLPLLPRACRLVGYDRRGHGLSSIGGGATLADHVDNAIAVIEAAACGPVDFVGQSVGGLIGQGVTNRRPVLGRALVLSNKTAT
jgi:3-oxoadipate enol-lactonase